MRVRAARVAGVVALVALVALAEAAKWSELRTCGDIGYCRRQRRVPYAAERNGTEAYVDAGSVRVEGGARVVAAIRAGASAPLALVVERYAHGVFRVTVDDPHARFPRYRPQGVLVGDGLRPQPIDPAHLEVDGQRATIRDPAHPSEVVIDLEPAPMRIRLRRDARDLVVLNDRDTFLFERQDPKPQPSTSPSAEPTDAAPNGDTADEPVHPDDLESARSLDDDHDVYEHYDDSYDDDNDVVDSADDDENDDDDGHDDHDDHDDSHHPEPTDLSDVCDGCYEESFKDHRDSKPRGPESIGLDLVFPNTHAVYGIPERTTTFSLPHTVKGPLNSSEFDRDPQRLFNLDVYEYELDKSFGTYGSVPFLLARGSFGHAGVFWHNAAETFVDIAKEAEPDSKTSTVATHWFSEAGVLDVFLLPGGSTPDSLFHQYRSLTGPSAMPSRFALGYHQCRWNYRDDADTRQVDAQFDKQDLPYDVIWLDIEHTDGKRYFTWDTDKFPDPQKLQLDIAARGRKLVTIVDPHIKRDDDYAIHKDATERGHYVKKSDGTTDFDGWCWPGSSSYFDFVNPEVRQAWASKFNPSDYPYMTEHLHIWNDMNEPSVFNGPEQTMHRDLKHHGGWEHRDVHNIYGMFVHQATFEGLKQSRQSTERPFVLSRAFFAGTQRFGAVWTGDNAATWDHLRSTVPMLLSLQVTHIVFSGADVGGFFGNPSPELLVRWYQAAAFQPFFRGHAHLDTARREPWLFGDDNTRWISAAIRTRYEYLPLWYTLFAGCALGDQLPFEQAGKAPPMRPLWWHFDDERVADVEDEWMVGDGLLVAPVLHEGATTRKVILPAQAQWFDLFDGGKLLSGEEVSLSVSMSRMLVFQRGGSIVPKQERRRRSTRAMAFDPIVLSVALDADGKARGDLYLDDGHTYDYETSGRFVLRRFSMSDGALSGKTVAGAEGSYGADVAIERIEILGVGKAPERVTVGDREVGFRVASGVVVIKQPGVLASGATWSLTLW